MGGRRPIGSGSSPSGHGLLATIVLAGGIACAGDAETSVDEAVARISAETLRAHVGVLAHDSMRGRDTDDIGYVRARDYVVSEFERIGLEPIVAGSYLQPFELVEVVSDQGSRVTVGTDLFTYPDVIVTPDWTGDLPSLVGEGIYVGHGLVTGEFEEAEGPDLNGKIVFVLAGAPEGRADEPEIAMRDRTEVELAMRAGAAAVVVLNPGGSERGWAARAAPRRPMRALLDGSSPSPRPAAIVGPSASERLLARWEAGPRNGGVGPVVIEPRHETRQVRSWNVGGIWPGQDPAIGEEAVVFTAHLDHVGVGPPDATGDSIYNGTHDNALGVAKVLAAAEALAGAQLRRSVLFLALGAEESGLLGSWYYVNNPIVPLSRTSATINHDGGLVDEPMDEVFSWGPEFSTLESELDRAAEDMGMVIGRDKGPPFAPSAGLLYRSDHYPFLISGVPVAYLMPGFTMAGDAERGRMRWVDYLATVHHVQADNFDPSASYESPVDLTGLSVRLAWRLANADSMPRTHADAPVAGVRGEPTGFFFAGGH